MTLLLEIFSNHIAPILVAAGIGVLFGRVFKPDLKPLARLAFYVLSPSLLFTALVSTNIPGDELLRLTWFTLSVVGTAGVLAWCIARLLKMTTSVTAALMLSCMFVNGGNYGLPLNLFAFGEDAMSRAMIFWMVSTMLIFSVGIVVASNAKAGFMQALVGIFKVPALYALALASLTRWLGWPIPPIVQRPVSILGQAAIPVMLLILGIQVGRIRWSGRLSMVGLIVGIRMFLMPALATWFAALFHLSGSTRSAAISQAAMPTAVIVTILALEYDTEPELVSEAVVATTLISPLTLTPLIAFLQS